MINPAIAYTHEMELIISDSDEAIDRWSKLYEKCREECTHQHADGSSSWFQIDVDLRACRYCSWTDKGGFNNDIN